MHKAHQDVFCQAKRFLEGIEKKKKKKKERKKERKKKRITEP